MCHTIAPDFSSKRTICSLNESKKNPTLAYYHNCVYLFGGHNGNFISSSAECVDLDSKSTRILACYMPLPIVNSVPCRYKNALYFGQVFVYSKGYIFHLDTERLDLLNIQIDQANSCLAIPFPNDEIVFLANSGIFTFLIQANKCYKTTESSSIAYGCNTIPVFYQGYWYFLGKNENDDTKIIFAMEERSKDFGQLGVIEEPEDLVQKLLKGDFRF
jgi:hypothetical protein